MEHRKDTKKVEVGFFQYWNKLTEWEKELIQHACKTYSADIKDVVFRVGGI
jgi:hypothetical protein